MSTDIARQEANGLSTTTLTAEQVDLVKRTIAVGASDDELALFIHQCNRTGLDPFAKQIYSIERRSKDKDGNWVTTRQTLIGIDGARLTAERVNKRRPGAYRPGPVEWTADGKEWVEFWASEKPPVAARATVYKDGEPVTAVANYKEFVQTVGSGSPNRQWTQMPAHQLGKCAEMLGLRRAFPQELSGLYIAEEPPLAGPKEAEIVVGEEMADVAQVAEIDALLDKLVEKGTASREALLERLHQLYKTTDLTKLNRSQANEVLERLRPGVTT